MNEWKRGYKLVDRRGNARHFHSVTRSAEIGEGRTDYIPGEIARPPSWMHGPLAVFTSRKAAALFQADCVGYARTLRVLEVAYRPSRFKCIWVPFAPAYLTGCSCLRCELRPLKVEKEDLPWGTALADEVYVFGKE